jgi:bifunctional non-homologous end joining protein LigD
MAKANSGDNSEMTEIEVAGRRVDVSRADKVLFPEDGITKGDLVHHYERVADVMLPHLAGRPLTMERFPDGIDGNRFYQKSASGHFPVWIRRVSWPKQDGTVDHVVADDAATLVYLANQAAVTFHTGLAREDAMFNPDQVVFDLDPADDDFGLVRETACEVRTMLEDLGLVPYVKTTGSRGLHVMVPVDRSATFEETHRFAAQLAAVLAARHPDELTTEVRKVKRAGRLFLDIGRNQYNQHAVAAYAVRPRPGAPVSTPIEWDEVTSRLGPQRWTLRNLARRLARRPCPWLHMYDDARPLPSI